MEPNNTVEPPLTALAIPQDGKHWEEAIRLVVNQLDNERWFEWSQVRGWREAEWQNTTSDDEWKQRSMDFKLDWTEYIFLLVSNYVLIKLKLHT